jgi:segregation and condensation protein A
MVCAEMPHPAGNLTRMPYEVSTPVFEGPFDLLLHLITKDQVDIYEVRLDRIVDAFLAELERMTHLDLEVVTEFLLIAAILVELKSRRLLPGRDDVENDEEFALWEQRDLLLSRLLECKTFKDAASELQRLMNRAERSVPRRSGLEEPFMGLVPDLLTGVTPEKVRDACIRALTPKAQPHVDLDHVAPVRASVRDAVDELLDELPRRGGRATFRELTAGIEERLTIIVRFLAVLELYKQGFVELEQFSNFGELTVQWVDDADRASTDIDIEEYAG